MQQKYTMFQLLKRYLLLILFVIGSISVTYYLIQKEKNKNPISEYKFVNEDQYRIQELTEMFYYSPIQYEYIEDKKGEFLLFESNGTKINMQQIEIKYPKISGLKNKVIQNLINQTIKETILNAYSLNELKQHDIKALTIYSFVENSFADVLSISPYGVVYKNDGTTEGLMPMNLNFSLETGKQIELNELFVAGTSIKNILSFTLYEHFVKKDNFTSSYERVDLNKIDSSVYDAKVIDTLNQFMKQGNIKFYFTPNELYIWIDSLNSYVTVRFISCYHDIAIYKRFLSSSNLYEEEEKQKRFVLDAHSYKVHIYGEITDNLFANIDGIYNKNSNYVPYYNEYVDQLKQQQIEQAQADKEHGYVYKAFIEINQNGTHAKFTVTECNYQFDIRDYQARAISEIAQDERVERGSINFNYHFSQEEKIEITLKKTTFEMDQNGNIFNKKSEDILDHTSLDQ